VIPIVTGHAMGAVVINDPDAVEVHKIHGGDKQFRTDKDGHYRFAVDEGWDYHIWVFNKSHKQANKSKTGQSQIPLLGAEAIVKVPLNSQPITNDLVLRRW
jgi:hypothetical protein